MNRIKYLAVILTVIGFLAFGSATYAASPSLPINWQQDSINWDQLQTLFQQNPDYRNFSIRFPNGTVWNADAAVMQAIHAAYLHHAEIIGYKGEVPDLVFSSLDDKYNSAKGTMNIPINKFMDNLQMGEQDILGQLDSERYSLWESLPSWLQKFLTIVWNGMVNFYDYIVDIIKKL